MTIDHKLITPIMCKDDPLHTCDIVGGGNRYAFRVNQDTLISANTKEYILAYRKKLFEDRGLDVPADHDLSWRKDQAPLWTMDNLADKATDLYLWVKFDELGLSNGDSITTITDSGPLGSVLTANNGITYDANGINSLGVANMTANNDNFSIPDHANLDIDSGQLEMYVVFKTSSDWNSTLDSLSDQRYFADKKDSSANFPRWSWQLGLIGGRGGATIKPAVSRLESGIAISKKGNTTTYADSTVFLESFIQVDQTFDFYHNGSANGTPSGNNVVDPDSDGILYIGNSSTKNQSIHSQLAEIIIIDHSLGAMVPQDSIREKIEGYLAHKWGIEGNLPADHTYKTYPPRRNAVYT